MGCVGATLKNLPPSCEDQVYKNECRSETQSGNIEKDQVYKNECRSETQSDKDDDLCDIKNFYDVDLGIILGTGISGIVQLVKHFGTGTLFAMKTLPLSRNRAQPSIDTVWQEVRIMREMKHPNIVRLHQVFETKDHLLLIMELCSGGELLDRLHKQERHCFPEKKTIEFVRSIVETIRYCHDHGIVHRDLKLENFLFDGDAKLKLIDFGLSCYYDDNIKMKRPVGTPYYVAPEVLKGSYSKECDLWSIGVITYMLLSGRPPFYGTDDQETLEKVSLGKYDFPSPCFDNVSNVARDFISKLLVEDTKRMTAEIALKHPWLQNSKG